MAKLILTTGIPLMLSLLINSLYNFVDSVFVSRVSEQAVKWAMIYSALLFLIFFAVLEFAPTWVLQIFETSDNMRQIAIPALRILTVSWLVSIPSLVMAASFQGFSLGTYSMALTMTRQAVLPVVFALILQLFGNLNLIWLGFILAELAGIPLALVLWKEAWRKAF